MAIIYDDQINSDGTTQVSTNIVDFRTTGVNINDSGLTGNYQQIYVAGTHFNDTFIGEPNSGNEYYFVGQDLAVGTPPSDTFTGGQYASNVAIFSDPISDFTFSSDPLTGSLTVTNTGDTLHAGSLTLTGMQLSPGVYGPSVQALAFGPSRDPQQNGDGTLEASAGVLYIIAPLYNPVTIDSGAVLEFSVPNNNTGGAVSATFRDTGGTLKLDAAAQNTPGGPPDNFTGQIILDARTNGPTSTDIIDLANLPVSSVASALLIGNTLTVTLTSGAGAETYNVVGGVPGTITPISDGAGGTDLLLTPGGSLWRSITSESITGGHLYTPAINIQGSVAAVVFGETSSGFVPGGPDTITLNLTLLDPFGLGYDSGILPLATYSIQNLPSKYNVILPTNSAGQQEAIVIYETQDSNGTPSLNQIVETATGGPNSSLSITTPSTPIETGLSRARLSRRYILALIRPALATLYSPHTA